MGKYTNEVPKLLELLGGKENISAATHCMTRLRLVLRIDLNMMMKMMIGNKLQGALDQIAEGIARAMNAAPQV